MPNETWFSEIESKVFSTVSYRLKRELRGKLSGTLKCTTDGASDSAPYFPTWYLHELEPMETGQDLTNVTVNAVIEVIEVQAYTKSKSECQLIMDETVVQMKALRFNVSMMPLVTSNTNVFTGVARFRRIVGGGDSDIITQ